MDELDPLEDHDFELTDELKGELDRRWEAHLANPEAAIPWEVVQERLRNQKDRRP